MDLATGFTLWRKLGMTSDGAPIPFDALIAVHWVHRACSVLVLGILGAIAWSAQQVPELKRPAQLLALVLAIQFLTGLSNVVFRWPLALAIAHNGGAALLVGLLAAMLVKTGRR
jgi:cytochrome c oxidase assembly protein subunit 15